MGGGNCFVLVNHRYSTEPVSTRIIANKMTRSGYKNDKKGIVFSDQRSLNDCALTAEQKEQHMNLTLDRGHKQI